MVNMIVMFMHGFVGISTSQMCIVYRNCNMLECIDITEEYEPHIEETLFVQIARQERMNKMYMHNADPNCDHHVVYAPGGGIRCTKCRGWYCT